MSGKRRPSVTLHDVARHAGVSSMTVSRVINDYAFISEAARAKVLKSIEALGYRPNAVARATRTGVAQVGVLYSNPNSSNLSAFLMGAFRKAGEIGCQLLIEPSAAHPTPARAVVKLIEAGVGAVVLPPPLCDDAKILKLLTAAGVGPVSFATAKPSSGVTSVAIDDFEGAAMMTRHLIALGHVDIAFIQGDPSHSTASRREEGFRATMAQAGLAVPDAHVVQGLYTYRSGLTAASQLLGLRRRPSAIFASNDDMAAAVSAVAHGMGIAVPTELSIAGFDDTPVASTIWPQLTTIHQPIADMAATAVELAAGLARRDADEDQARKHVLAELTLVVRQSTAAPAG
ncbi:LacI family DNA-binding transcriptional regulator [Caulobacter sp. LjRoot300]|uniref:LacI family DNA-binding transcriptional regulator n=1 Tax=Caulobacter sp. LjRoot300 TaxID=3342321 RepID=UPI003ECE9572